MSGARQGRRQEGMKTVEGIGDGDTQAPRGDDGRQRLEAACECRRNALGNRRLRLLRQRAKPDKDCKGAVQDRDCPAMQAVGNNLSRIHLFATQAVS